MTEDQTPTSAEERAAAEMQKAEAEQQAQAEKDASSEAKDIAKSAAKNKPDEEEEAAPEPEKKEDTTFVVYKAVRNQPYPGRYLTVTVPLEGGEEESVVLEEGVPAEHPKSVAKALAALRSASYTIESA